MRALLPVFFLLATLFTTCRANSETGDQTLLWKISGKGLSKPSFLFGTIHMLCPEDYLWTPAMKAGLAASDKVCFELDLDDPGLMAAVGEGMLDTSGKSLREYFTPEEYARLSRFVRDSLGADLSFMQMMKPVMLQTLFLTKTAACAFPVSYEVKIMEAAHGGGKEVIGLETPQEQLDLFDGIPDDSAAQMVMSMVDSFAEHKLAFARMVATYRAQDLPGLYDLVIDSRELGENMGPFLDERNKKWVSRIEGAMSSGAVFFGLGAAHLWGETGLINLLRKAGYTISPMPR